MIKRIRPVCGKPAYSSDGSVDWDCPNCGANIPKEDCPMTEKKVNENNLTDKQIERFCGHGCSVVCSHLLDEHISRVKK